MALVLLGTLVFVLVSLGRLVMAVIRGRHDLARAIARAIGRVVLGYTVVLVAVGLLTPRRTLAAGARRCYDDWCVATIDAVLARTAVASCPGANVWIVRLEVSSDAKRVRQRAADATALLEDSATRHYPSCDSPGPATLRDELGPGESFEVALAFALPAGRVPAGVMIRHGYVPGCLIIGDDQSLAHRPTLYRLALPSSPEPTN